MIEKSFTHYFNTAYQKKFIISAFLLWKG